MDEVKESEVIVRPVREMGRYKSNELKRLAKDLTKLHKKFLGLNVQGLRTAIHIGYLLWGVKKGLPHGAFHQWIENDFEDDVGFGIRTAQRYMSKAKEFLDFVQSRGVQCTTEAELEHFLGSTQWLAEFMAQPKRLAVSRPSVKSETLDKSDPNEWRSPPAVIDAVKLVLGTICCDPCALPESWDTDLADFNYTSEQNGLSALAWQDNAWICPGHEIDARAWYEKACSEMECHNLSEAILCLPETTRTLPLDLLRRPLAITPEPLNVVFRESGKEVLRPLPTRSLFVYLTAGEPNLSLFAEAFRDIAVVFAPVVTHSVSLS